MHQQDSHHYDTSFFEEHEHSHLHDEDEQHSHTHVHKVSSVDFFPSEDVKSSLDFKDRQVYYFINHLTETNPSKLLRPPIS